MPLTSTQQGTTATAWDDSGSRVAVIRRQGGSWRAVLVGLGLFGTDLGTHDSVEVAMQAVEGRWAGGDI
jgi:YD repeat-containing protein